MEKDRTTNFAARVFLLIVAIAALIIGKTLLIPLIVAVFFTFLLYPLSKSLERFKIPKSIAIILSIICSMVVIFGVFYFFIVQINSLQEDLPQLKIALNLKANQILALIESKTGIGRAQQINWFQEKVTQTAENGPGLIMDLFSVTGTVIAMFALIPLYIFFLTYLREKYKKFIILVSPNHHQMVLEIIKKTSTVSVKYLRGVIIDVMILSVLGSIGYLLLDIQHAILFGVIAAILNIVPYIGVLIGSLLPVLMAIITKDDIGYAFGALGVALVVQFIDNNFISPYVVGSSVSLNPMSAIIVLIIGAMMWGIPGMILSVPLAGMTKVVFDNIEHLKPWGYLIGEEVNYQDKKFFKSKK